MPPKSRSSTSKATSNAKSSLGFTSSKRSASSGPPKKKGTTTSTDKGPVKGGGKVKGERSTSELSGLYQRLYKDALKRMGPPIHRDGMDDIEIILRQFDQQEEFGPCSRISRLERFERAQKLGLNPDPEIGDILRSPEGKARKEYSESVFQI
ncbi:hypothetical protein JCM10212_002296 [Sporobolomyces blumeae]